ncbi:hypothetical protein [Yersinia enterocolitica]|uniref:hypothetical protein n=1 Tax=Yersinia enterocolitica TaxID=630 RepID=UPI003CFE85D2
MKLKDKAVHPESTDGEQVPKRKKPSKEVTFDMIQQAAKEGGDYLLEHLLKHGKLPVSK